MGLLDALELSDEQIADSIWLALQMDKVETASKPELEEQPDSSPLIEIQESEPQALVTEAEPTVSIIPEKTRDSTPQQPNIKGLPFQVPAAPALLNVLQLGRALRPLMRKVPSLTQEILDEEATVNQIVVVLGTLIPGTVALRIALTLTPTSTTAFSGFVLCVL